MTTTTRRQTRKVVERWLEDTCTQMSTTHPSQNCGGSSLHRHSFHGIPHGENLSPLRRARSLPEIELLGLWGTCMDSCDLELIPDCAGSEQELENDELGVGDGIAEKMDLNMNGNGALST